VCSTEHTHTLLSIHLDILNPQADTYVCELSDTGKLPNPWTLRDQREMATLIVGRAWERLQADPALIERGFLHCGISIHPDGHEDYLINIKGVDNSFIDPNEWRSSSDYRSYEVILEDFCERRGQFYCNWRSFINEYLKLEERKKGNLKYMFKACLI
jgi:hypothetical protein